MSYIVIETVSDLGDMILEYDDILEARKRYERACEMGRLVTLCTVLSHNDPTWPKEEASKINQSLSEQESHSVAMPLEWSTEA